MLYPDQWSSVADQLTVEHFHDPRHQAIWGAMMQAWPRHRTLDVVTLVTTLGGNVAAAGGLSYLSAISDHITAMGASYYVPLVVDAYQRRCMFLATEQMRNDVAACSSSAAALTLLVETARRQEEQHKPVAEPSMREALRETFRVIEACQAGQSGQIQTGLDKLDEALVMMPPDLVLMAARPGCGKTAMAMNIARHMLTLGRPVGFISLEMSRSQLLMRWISMMTGISVDRMRRKDGIYDNDFPRLTDAAQQMAGWSLHIEDGTDKTIADIRQVARGWRQQHGIELLVVDYFQLLAGGDGFNSREQEMAHCSRQLKSLCKELGIPALVLCQMNRELERRRSSKNPNPRPTMADLRETGQLEQDADIITFLHSDDDDPDSVSLIIAKQRQGRSGVDVPLRFARHSQRFETA